MIETSTEVSVDGKPVTVRATVKVGETQGQPEKPNGLFEKVKLMANFARIADFVVWGLGKISEML